MLLAIPAAGRTAFAHGGQYRGPAGEVPPGSRDPQDPPPPESGGSTPTPPDGGEGTPTPPDGPGGGTPTPPGGDGAPTPDNPGGDVPQPPGPGGPGGTNTPGKKAPKKGASFESWLFWWNYNKDEILNLKRRLRSGLDSSGDGIGTMSGTDGAPQASELQDVTAQRIRAEVVPILERYARDASVNYDIQASGVLGLARVGHRNAIPLLMDLGRNRDGRQDRVVEETACLALGILQDRSPQVRRFLLDRASDPAAKARTRCFSLFALGLLGDPDAAAGVPGDSSGSRWEPDPGAVETLRELQALASRPDEQSRDVICSALVAVGLLGDRAAVPELLRWLREEKAGSRTLTDLELSFVAAALGKIGQPGLSGPDSREVVDALRDRIRRKDRMTRYSAVIALGQIATQADEKTQRECVSSLTDVIRHDGKATSDTQTVNFALASLGRIGGAPTATKEIRDQSIRTIGAAFENGSARAAPFAALALGLAGMNADAAAKTQLAEVLRERLSRDGGDADRCGAMVIALGLLRDIRSAGQLQAILQENGRDPALRGLAAVALGLIGDPGARDPIRKVLQERTEEKLRVEAAVALGLLRDSGAVDTLVDILENDKSSQFVLGSVTQALGQIGDQRAIAPLVAVLEDPKKQYSNLTRALAAVALGQMGDVHDVPVLSRLSKDVNYRAYFNAIGEVLTIL